MLPLIWADFNEERRRIMASRRGSRFIFIAAMAALAPLAAACGAGTPLAGSSTTDVAPTEVTTNATIAENPPPVVATPAHVPEMGG